MAGAGFVHRRAIVASVSFPPFACNVRDFRLVLHRFVSQCVCTEYVFGLGGERERAADACFAVFLFLLLLLVLLIL